MISSRIALPINLLAGAGLALVGLLAFTAESKVVEPQDHYGAIASRFAKTFPRAHVEARRFDDEVGVRAFDRFIDSLDYAHIYFMQSDIDRFRNAATFMDDAVSSGDLTFPYEVFAVFKERVNDRYAFIQEVLSEDFDLTRSESYRWKRKNAPWAEDRGAWDDLWRRKVKHEYLQRHVRELLAKDAAEEAPAADDGASLSAPGPELDPPKLTETTTTIVEITAPDLETLAPVADLIDAPSASEADVSGATEPDAGPENDAEAKLAPTAQEFILKQYEQFVGILNDYEEGWVLERYLSAFAHAFDPHSDYMSPAAVSDFNIEMRLSLVGIGALLRSVDGTAEIIKLIPGGPAEQGGELQPGDRIVGVAQEGEETVDTLHWPLSKTVQIIRGETGTVVTLTVIPASDPSGTTTREISIRRDVVKLEEGAAKSSVESIENANGANYKIGVIDLPSFYVDIAAKSAGRTDTDFRSCVNDVRKLLVELKDEKIDGLILDLRNNGGGSLSEAIELTGLFIPQGPVVQVKQALRKSVYSDPDPKIHYEGPLVVLVNRLSASASEILAGALQDYGRAIIIGDQQTHGKGTVQTVLSLDNTDAIYGKIKVTTASYYRIRGGSTQLKGVAPDVVVSSSYDSMDIGEGALSNPLPWTMVRPVRFNAFANLRPAVRVLREKSERRIEGDERHQRRQELLDHMTTLRDTKDVSLRVEDALALARKERKLRELQEEVMKVEPEEPEAPVLPEEGAVDEGAEDAEKAPASSRDLILQEALHIMSDFIDYQSDPLEAASAR